MAQTLGHPTTPTAALGADSQAPTQQPLPSDLRLDGFGWWDVAFLAALVLICGLAASVGVAPLRLFQQDIFFFLDNGYRVLQGQVPHRDFSSAWGPVTYMIEATGLLLSGTRPAGVGYANAVFGALIGAWAYLLARARYSS